MAAAVSLFLLFAALPVPARAGKIDLARPPVSFCAPALAVAAQTSSCAANGTFLSAAKDCLVSLNRLEATLGGAAAAIAQGGTRSQQGENTTGHAEYGYSSAALTYLIAVAGTAKREIAEYEDYVAPPPVELEPSAIDPANPMGWAYGVGCFRDAESGLQDAVKSFGDKLQRYAARRAEAQAFEAKLATRGTSYESLSGPQATGRAQGSRKPVPQWKSTGGGSDITGVQQDKQKQNQGN